MDKYFEYRTQKTCYSKVDGRCELCGSYAKAILKNENYSLVCFESERVDTIPESVYRFDYVIKADAGVSYRVTYRFYDKNGINVFTGCLGRGVIFYAPRNAYKLDITVFIYSYAGGSAEFYACGIERLTETKPRRLKLAAISGAYPGEDHGGVFEHTLEKNAQNAARMLDAAAAEGAQLALLTERYNTQFVNGISAYEGSAELTDPAVQVLSDKAKEHGMFVAAGVSFKDSGLIYNAQLIFDPHGALVGKYAKSHLTDGDLSKGFVPGSEISVFDTEIGRLGCSICWDLYFPEHARTLYLKEAEIMLHSTESTTPLQLADTAESDSMFIAVAQSCKRTGDIVKTRIIGRGGQELAHATTEKPFACAEIDLTEEHPFFWGPGDQKSQCMGSRRPELYKALSDESIGYQAASPLTYYTGGYKDK